MVTGTKIANEFIEIADKDITLLKLVKLVYIAQGFSLAILDRPAFNEPVEAWKYGPVVPSVYHAFKHYKKNPIKDKAFELVNIESFKFEAPVLNDEKLKKIVQIVWNLYKDISAERLVELTHHKGTPWDLTYRINEYDLVIENYLIKKYYDKIVAKTFR